MDKMAFFEIYVCKVKSSRKRGAAETMTSRYRFTAATGHCGTIIGQFLLETTVDTQTANEEDLRN